MKLLQAVACLVLVLQVSACTKWWGSRTPSSSHTLPPAKPAGVEHAPADEPPILNTPQGFVRSEVPRVDPKKKKEKPKVFKGTSD